MRKASNIKYLWIDARNYSTQEIFHNYCELAINSGYKGILVDVKQMKWCQHYPKNIRMLIYVNDINDITVINELEKGSDHDNIIVSEDESILQNLMDMNHKKAMYMYVDNMETLERTMDVTDKYEYVIIDFKDSTNIPLELVLAYSQKNNCMICKRVNAGQAGWIASMVMEVGSPIILLETSNMEDIVEMNHNIERLMYRNIQLKELTVTGSKHIGMGDRICIDTTSNLKEDEGIILGSTSAGGILVSSETHYLPYMELRPFRVNAGAVHMYTWNFDEKTNYLSELKAGSTVMVVDSKGNTREVHVGRIKIERRPILLLFAKDTDGNEVNVALQDDWHVRVIGVNGDALNCTELKVGDHVLGYTCESGRHVGYKINESIIEK